MVKGRVVLTGALGLAGLASGVHGSATFGAKSKACWDCATGHTNVDSCGTDLACSSATCADKVATGEDAGADLNTLCKTAGDVVETTGAKDGKCVTPVVVATTGSCAGVKESPCANKYFCNAGTCALVTWTAPTAAFSDPPGGKTAAAFPDRAQSTGAAAVDVCSAGKYYGADTNTAAKCSDLPTAALNSLCVVTRTTANGVTTATHGCGSGKFCDTTTGRFATVKDESAKLNSATQGPGTMTSTTIKGGMCKAEIAKNTAASADRTIISAGNYGCAAAAPLVDGSGKCQEAITLDAAVTKLTADCKTAVEAFAELAGHNLKTTYKTAKPSMATNCYKIVEEDVNGNGQKSWEWVYPSTTADHIGKSGAVPKCGMCSDECYGAASKAITECSTEIADVLIGDKLPFFKYAGTWKTQMDLDARGPKDPCWKGKHMQGCGTAARSYKSDWTKSTATDKPSDTKTTAFKSACAVVHVSGGAASSFASAGLLTTIAMFATFLM